MRHMKKCPLAYEGRRVWKAISNLRFDTSAANYEDDVYEDRDFVLPRQKTRTRRASIAEWQNDEWNIINTQQSLNRSQIEWTT